ncbi:hypothetical protein GQF02_00440 [Neisseriaceae bacterium B2N2-7]|uniref:Uncharacterized protein n=1 Tax=Craterilacuibacter sinensis TaxID=2686017 RepID=A0A845BFD4_9NEIS|nr:hypothetical protein [Craterilacuibacter sinensis]
MAVLWEPAKRAIDTPRLLTGGLGEGGAARPHPALRATFSRTREKEK